MVGAGKESESLLACYQSITFLVSRVRSLLGEPPYFTLRTSRKNSSYLHTKQRPLWLQVSIPTLAN